MSKFKVGDSVTFKEQPIYAPAQMTVGKAHGASPYCECFYFTEGSKIAVLCCFTQTKLY